MTNRGSLEAISGARALGLEVLDEVMTSSKLRLADVQDEMRDTLDIQNPSVFVC